MALYRQIVKLKEYRHWHNTDQTAVARFALVNPVMHALIAAVAFIVKNYIGTIILTNPKAIGKVDDT